MNKIIRTIYFLVLISSSLFSPFSSSAQETNLTFQYSCIKDYGSIADMNRKAGSQDKVVNSEDGKTAYIVRSVSVKSESHLLQLMGVSAPEGLTDLQNGLLETYRFSANADLMKLKERLPKGTGNINVELVDINGFTNPSQYPNLRKDFWPQNSTTSSYNGKKYVSSSNIRISGTDCIGYGPSAAKTMQATFAHEFGHSLDLTAVQMGDYGFDNSHFANEKIATQASFAEGFANFIKMLFFPEEEQRYRRSLSTIKIERPEGGYDEYQISDGMLKGEEYLDVEAINALIFTKLADELPDGKKIVLDSFEKHNSRGNRMALFLRNFIKDYPLHAEKVAEVLNRETYGNLSDEEFRKILGSNSGTERFLAGRSKGKGDSIALPPPTRREAPSYKPGTIFKWKDADGNMHFTDTPPSGDFEFTTMGSEPMRGRDAEIDNAGDNPFNFR